LSDPRLVSCHDGRLVVADRGNHRVLIWNTLPNDFNSLPSVVLGQPDFDTATPNAGELGLNAPTGGSLINATGALAIADTGNHRVLLWDSLPQTRQAAQRVVGQPDFDTVDANQGGSASARTLNFPWSATFFRDGLLIADSGNHRVLIHTELPVSNNETADAVTGQPDMASSLPNQNGAAAADTLDTPHETCASVNAIVVADQGNHRVLVYGVTGNALATSAQSVLGQPDMMSEAQQATSAASLRAPGGCTIVRRTLWVADTGNHRVLRYTSR